MAPPSDRSTTHETAALWVRVGLVALAVPQAITGVWAIADGSGWFEDFPGFEPRLAAAEPPFNAHLTADAGGGFLATAVVLLVGAWWADRRSVRLALLTYLAFAVPHLTYHALNPAPGLTDAEDLRNVVTLGVGAALPLVLWWATLRRGRDRARSQRT